MEDNIKQNLINWENSFNQYIEIDILCMQDLNSMSEIKNNLTTLLGNQKKDDILFYKSILDNSYFYLTNSIKIRILKFIKDLNIIWLKMTESKQIECLDKNTFSLLLKDYQKIADDINNKSKNKKIIRWIKDDKLELLQDLDKDMTELMTYHLNLLSYFKKYIELEKTFFSGNLIVETMTTEVTCI